MGTVTYLQEWKFRRQSEKDRDEENRRFAHWMSIFSDEDLQTDYDEIHREFELITTDKEDS